MPPLPTWTICNRHMATFKALPSPTAALSSGMERLAGPQMVSSALNEHDLSCAYP